MPNIIISGNFPDGFDLSNPLTNPVTVTGTIALGTSGLSGALQGETVAAWSIDNQGSVLGQTAAGIFLLAGGTVTNESSALVSGAFAIEIQGTAGTVVNGGTLDAASGGSGVYLAQGGSVSNLAGGQFQFGLDGVTARGAAANVSNAGIINADTSGASVDLFAGGTVVNAAGGTLAGDYGISIQGAATGSVVNGGVITGGTLTGRESGVFLNGGTVTNQAGGTITGDFGIAMAPGTLVTPTGTVIIGAAGTVITGGTIVGLNGTAVSLPSGFANLLTDDPGAVFSGLADGGNVIGDPVVSTLELGAAALQGTLNGLGTNFINFGRVVVDLGGAWMLTGANNLAAGATLTDQGMLVMSAATLVANGAETIDGTTNIAASVTVTGGGVWSGSSALVVGGAASGSFLISGHGSVAVATAVLGADAGGTGSLDVTGVGGGFSTTSSLMVGQGGGGYVTILNQAKVQVGGVTDMGSAAGGTGEITVSGSQSVLAGSGQVIVGDAGVGSLSIQAGGTVTTTAGATIANTASASGSSVNVTGAGSNLRVGGALVVGAAATGSLGVAAGASVTAGSLDAGGQAGSAGIVTLSGNASTLTTTGTIGVGDSGIGEFQVLNGATLNVGGDFNVGQLTGGSGVADFENPGGTVILGGNLNIGLGGGPAEVIIGLNSPVQFDNGGENVGANGKLIQYTAFDPLFANNTGVIDLAAGTTPYLAYFNNAGGTLGQASGVSSILQSPTIYGAGGLIQVGAGSSLVLDVGAVSNQSIGFASNAGTLEIGIDNLTTIDVPQSGTTGFTKEANPNLGQALIGGFAGTINASFAATNTIVVDTTAAATFAVNGSVVTVSTGGSLAFASAALAQTAFNTAGALVDQVLACFAAGTRIETVDGPVAVEKLRVGDEVRTILGGPGRIVWVGSREVNGAAHPRPESAWPIRIARGAFGAGLPQRDLFVSPDHAIYLDGVLIPAKLLVNGTTVRQVKRRLVTYHHIELERHDVVLAEGLPAETYLDAGDRANFAGETTVRLYPDFAARLAPDVALVWETKGAAPLVVAGEKLAAARRLAVGTASPRARNEVGARQERSAA